MEPSRCPAAMYDLRISGKLYVIGMKATLANMGAAYGFTLAIWGSGALAAATYGTFTTGSALIHVGCAYATYVFLIPLFFRPKETARELAETEYPSYGFLHFFSLPAAIGASYLAYLIPWRLFGLGLGGFLTTLVYTLVFALEWAVVVPKEKRKTMDPEHYAGSKSDAV